VEKVSIQYIATTSVHAIRIINKMSLSKQSFIEASFHNLSFCSVDTAKKMHGPEVNAASFA
jgi:hypothetical protein